MALFNGPQSRAILCGILDVHRRMADLESFIHPGDRPTAFSTYVNDLSPTEAKVVQDYFGRIRTAMLGHLKACEIPLEARPASLRWALQTGLSFIGITVEELRPAKLRGYGPLSQKALEQCNKVNGDLGRLVDQVATYLRQRLGRDLHERLARLEKSQVGLGTLSQIETIIARWQLVEFRPPLEMIVSRLEAPSFEVAVFGRVSSGKSSLLNHLAGVDALPVGVTPVTAVPTRLVASEVPSVVVSFAETKPCTVGLEHVGEYASEEGNPGNGKHVTGILVKLCSKRLKEGVVFVDTPGVGSLALSGGAETLAYLPRCDLGVILVDSASVLNQEDVALLRALYDAAIPAVVLLSKADLLSLGDRVKMTAYIREQLRRELGLDLPVHPVSTVGTDESLLVAWFDRELTPLLDRHRSLAAASLKRKIALLRESVAATLETLVAKRRGGAVGDGATFDTAAAGRILDETDDAIRRTQMSTSAWWAGRQDLVATVPRLIAQRVVSSPDQRGEGVFDSTLLEAILLRGRMALELISSLQDALGQALERLSSVAPLAPADPSSIRDFHAGGLPAPGLAEIRGGESLRRPAWAALAPGLAVRITERLIEQRFGKAIKDAVEFHDRQLESWVKAKLCRLVELYEAQAGAIREQVRRFETEAADAGPAGRDGDLEADLRELRATDADATAAARADGPAPEEFMLR